jgi:hypothetical protein
MELGLPTTAAGVTTSTGLNQGYAQVLDKSSFDPIGFLENFNKAMLKKQEDEAKKQLELKNKWAKAIVPDIENINVYNRDELMSAANELEDKAAELMAAGVPFESPEAQKAIGEVQRRIKYFDNMGKDITQMLPKRLEQAKNFPPEQWNKYIEGLEKQPTIEDRYRYVAGNNPFKKPFDDLAMIKAITPKEKIEEVILRGNRSQKTVSIPEEGIRSLYDAYISNPTTMADAQARYDEGVEQGLWEDAEGMKEYFVRKVKEMNPNKVTLEGSISSPRSSSSSASANASIGEGQFGDVTVIPSGLSTDSKIAAINNPEKLKTMTPEEISKTALRSVEGFTAQHGIYNLTYKDNTQFKEGNFTSLEGGSVKGKPQQIYYSEDGSLWAVLGDEKIPLALNPDYIKDNELIKRAKANQRALAESFNYANFEEVLNYIRGAKTGKGAATMKMNDGGSGTTKPKENAQGRAAQWNKYK